MIWVDLFAKGDVTKYNDVFKLNVVEALNVLAFKLEQIKNAEQK